MLIEILVLFIILILGIFILFGCKVSQANVLPTDIHCFPYTQNVPSIQEIPINMNVTNLNGETFSQKIYFPYKYNSTFSLLDYLRNIKENTDGFNITAYFVELIMKFIQFNYSLTTGFYNTLNSYLPESVILFLSPFLLIFVSIFFVFFNFFYFIYNWFSTMSVFFQEKINKSNDGKTNTYISFLDPFRFGRAYFLVFIFSLLLMFGFIFIFPIFYPVLFIVSFFYALFSPFGMRGFTKINNTLQEITFFQFMKNILKDKKQIIMIIISILTIFNSINFFNGMISVLFFVIFLLFWFGMIPNNLYVNEVPPNLSKLSSYHLANKKCDIPKKMFSYGFWDLFKPQKNQQSNLNQNGGTKIDDGGLLQSLQKLSKKFNLYTFEE